VDIRPQHNTDIRFQPGATAEEDMKLLAGYPPGEG